MKPVTVVLQGPQAIGKTTAARVIADAFGCTQVFDDWNGCEPLQPGTLAITNAEALVPRGGVLLSVSDENGLAGLVTALTPSAETMRSNTDQVPRTCIKCKHYSFKFRAPQECIHPSFATQIDLVTGKGSGPICQEMRTEGGACGPQGALFESFRRR